MISFIKTLPTECYVAVSGGPDSMAVLDFLTNKPERDVTVLHFNHGTEFGNRASQFVEEYCNDYRIPIVVDQLTGQKEPEESPEEFWRNQRYEFFSRFTDKPIVMAHNLDDVLETYLFTTLHGNAYIIPYQRENIIRPFMLTKKRTLQEWCDRKNVPYMVDPSNENRSYMRSIVRHDIVPNALKVNPGLYKVISKKVIELYED